MSPNELLFWMSAKKTGTWSRYKAAVEELLISEELSNDEEDIGEDIPDNANLPIYLRLKFNFERLGHAEFFRRDFNNGWRVVPPILVCSYDKTNAVGILCGARTNKILDNLQKSNEILVTLTTQIECPDRIEIITENQGELEQIAASIGLYYQANTINMFMASVPPVDNWQYRTPAELPFGEDREVHRFSVDSLGWSATTAEQARNASFGLYRFKFAYLNEYYIKLRNRTYKIPVHTGKYLVLRKKRKHVVIYNTDNQTFSVPVSCRPPILVDRALTLCSGLIPYVNCGLLTYTNVNSSVAMTAAKLLRQKTI